MKHAIQSITTWNTRIQLFGIGECLMDTVRIVRINFRNLTVRPIL